MKTAEELYQYCEDNKLTDGQSRKWGLKHFGVVAAQLEPDEDVRMAFIGLHNQDGMKNDGNFAYDCIIPEGVDQAFKIYQNTGATVKYDDFEVLCNKKSCRAIIENECVLVTCPKGKKCTVSLRLKNSKICDKILVRNPRKTARKLIMYWQKTNIHKCKYES